MTVHFIGAGPGAADLITVRGRDLIAASPVCLYAGALVPVELLDHCPPGARKIDTANLTLDEIIAELATAHTAGQDVARLHSGDPSVFSAMAEQMRRLDILDIPYDVTPGVPAYAAAAATLARELTVPEVGQTVILTRIGGSASAMPAGEDLPSLGASRATLVVHLAVQQIDRVVDELIPNYGPECPVAVVARASRDDELVLRGTLADIAGQVKSANIRRTAVIIAGKVLSATTFRDSHLYSADRAR
ncbi:precorrin-4 C(11)-methyltransferase [Kribbella sp. NPDC049584]|uniref:precorrin-4 C(11)-methyltransferase n=1 Tax=Kribbella sp. NPDC049584 TaxID=3154833 RepID=UPI00341C751F